MHDAHCHLSTEIKTLPSLNTLIHCNLMSTNQFDIDYVFTLAQQPNSTINPCFGIHPWYSHLFKIHRDTHKLAHYQSVIKNVDPNFVEILPEPIYLQDYILKVEKMMLDSKKTAMIGEVGLDKTFKLPWSGFYGSYHLDKPVLEGPDGKKLSNYYVSMPHQQLILTQFLQLALKFDRPVSLHCVRAHGALLDLVKSSFPHLKVALHSYSGSIDHAKAWLKWGKGRVFFSISHYFNMGRLEYALLIELVPVESLLLETDFGLDGYSDDEAHLRDLDKVLESISEIKNIGADELRRVLEENWDSFIHPGIEDVVERM